MKLDFTLGGLCSEVRGDIAKTYGHVDLLVERGAVTISESRPILSTIAQTHSVRGFKGIEVVRIVL